MTLYKFVFGIILMTISTTVTSQERYSFTNILREKLVNKTFINKSKDDTTWRTYLGKITDGKRRTRYFVIKEFNKIAAAASWHGRSNIYFFNPNMKLVARIDVALPENLPFKLYNNYIFFRDNENQTIYKVKIQSKLPNRICITPNWCEEMIFKLRL